MEDITKDEKSTLELSISERISFQNILPDKSNAITLILVKSILEKVQIKKEEIETLKFVSHTKEVNGQTLTGYNWNRELEKPLVVTLEKSEVELLKSEMKRLDDEKALTLNTMSLYTKIRDIK